jgi:thiol-disulfide isomerase/thioredoxin/Flp pilus assembly protein TadD
LLAVLALAAVGSAAYGQENSDEVAAAVAQGDAFFRQRNYEKAVDSYRKADKLSHHTCAACLLRMVRVDQRLGDLSAALDDAKRAVKAAGDDKATAATAHLIVGTLLAEKAGKPGDKKLKEAEQEFREVLALDPTKAIAHFDLAVVLMRQERDTEGLKEVQAYLAMPGGNPRIVSEARRIAANPILAREPLAPDFSFETLEGGKISNAGLRGQVVLLDFWGTWCQPCRESVPMLQDIRKRYRNRPFEVVGISSDGDEEALKGFLAKHRMDWPEYMDQSGQVQEAFQVESFPTYIVLDKDGVVRFRQSGVGPATASELDEAINKAIKKAPDPRLAVAASVTPETSAEEPPPAPALKNKTEDVAPAREAKLEHGTISGNIYRDDDLGFTYQFPQGWTAARPEALRAANEKADAAGRAAFRKQHPELGDSVVLISSRTIFYASRKGEGDAMRPATPSVRITVVATGLMEVRRGAVDARVAMMDRVGLKVSRPTEEYQASERQFFRTDFQDTVSFPRRWMSQIQTAAEGNLFTLEILATSAQELDKLVSTAKSISFDHP